MRGINKRGQGDLGPIPMLVVIVIVVIVGGILIWGFLRGSTYIFDKQDILPGELSDAVAGCQIAAEGNIAASYCYEPKKLNDKLYANCDEETIRSTLQQQSSLGDFECESRLVETNFASFCQTKIGQNKWADVGIDSGDYQRTCEEWIALANESGRIELYKTCAEQAGEDEVGVWINVGDEDVDDIGDAEFECKQFVGWEIINPIEINEDDLRDHVNNQGESTGICCVHSTGPS